MVVLPHVLPTIAAMRKKGLKMLLAGLTLVSLVSKVAYSYDLNCWGILEGMCSAKTHPNLMCWNITRFNPFYCLLEVRATAAVLYSHCYGLCCAETTCLRQKTAMLDVKQTC